MKDDASDGSGVENDLDSNAVTMYKGAADISNKALSKVVSLCKPGALIRELCVAGDDVINEEVSKVFKGKEVEKGVAFPTCVSVNDVVGHFCPVEGDAALQAGDVVKIDLGTHINGFIATSATTVVCADDPLKFKVDGRKADVIACANTCFEAAIRLIKPGKKTTDIPPVLEKIAKAFDCSIVEGVMTHQMKQFIIDGNIVVLNRPTPDMRSEEREFEVNSVYAIDIVVSTGEGRSAVKDEKETTVYKRALDVESGCKLQAARAVLSEVNRRFPTMPFTIRALKSEKVKLALTELERKGLLHQYPVLRERPGELVAQIKGTSLLTSNGSDRVTVSPLPELATEKKVEDKEIQALLQSALKKSRKSKKKAAKKDGA
ncbi:unnamed protein product [Pedinophyceae sp. YPF-701]|nr:unnamed protein product [Pedinophyceae sp. YPF-701]